MYERVFSVRVSTVAAEFLDSVFDLPVVNLREASPMLYKSNARLQLTSQYRAKLIKLKVRPVVWIGLSVCGCACYYGCDCACYYVSVCMSRGFTS